MKNLYGCTPLAILFIFIACLSVGIVIASDGSGDPVADAVFAPTAAQTEIVTLPKLGDWQRFGPTTPESGTLRGGFGK